METSSIHIKSFILGGATVAALAAAYCYSSKKTEVKYSLANQRDRCALSKLQKNNRVLNIQNGIYRPSYARGKVVLVTGGNRGLGLAISQELISQGAVVYVTSRAPFALTGAAGVISGIDVQNDDCGDMIVKALNGKCVDIVINNAGYFYEPEETLTSLNFREELKMIDICALGILRVTAALFNAGSLKSGAKVACITSQGGSIAWRTVQNPNGHDYGHHMSKAAANMAGVLMSLELQEAGVALCMLHPGFNKTEMTAKYKSIWEIEGAVDAGVGAMRVVHEIGRLTLDRSGEFINCEDGLSIPW